MWTDSGAGLRLAGPTRVDCSVNLDWTRANTALRGSKGPEIIAALHDGPIMTELLHDAAVTWRLLVKHKSFALSVVLLIGVGAGLLTAMCALAEPFLFRPLPYFDPDQIVALSVRAEQITSVSQVPTIAEWSDRSDLFAGVAWIGRATTYRVRQQDSSAMLYALPVSTGLLGVLGVTPRAGQVPGAEEQSTVVLTPTGAARLRLSDEPAAGAVLQLQDGQALRIAAVLPDGFLVPKPGFETVVDALRPGATGPVASVLVRGGRPTEGEGYLVARLQPGVTAARVESSLSRTSASGPRIVVNVSPLSDRLTGDGRRHAVVGVLAGLFVLLISTANVANLCAVRLRNRASELFVRRALGATRLRIARLWGLELAVLTAAGILLGLALAHVALTTTADFIPRAYVSLGTPVMTWRSTAVAALLTPLLLCLTVVLSTAVRRPGDTLTRGFAKPSARAGFIRFAFVALQTAFAMILAVGAAVLVQSYRNLVSQQTGIDPRATSVMVSYPPSLRGAALVDVLERSASRLRLMPGISDVAYTQGTIVDGAIGFRAASAIWIGSKMVESDVKPITTGAFDLAGLEITAGRGLRTGDENYSAVVVNDVLVQRYLEGKPPIGEQITVANRGAEIVGVIAGVHDRALDVAPRPTVYHLMPPASGALISYLVETGEDTETPAGEIQRTLSAVDPDVIVIQTATLQELLLGSILDRTFAAIIAGSFALVGLIVSLVGVTGLVAVVVTDRLDEMAIRVALGAPIYRIRRLAMSGVFGAAAVGIAAGTLAGQVLSTLLSSVAFGVGANSWAITLIAAASVLVLAGIAAIVPTRRVSLQQATGLLRGR